MRQTAVIFPGQGSQLVGMGRELAEKSPRARAVFDEARDIVGFDLAKTCFDGPASELEKTDIQQPAIFVTSVAIWEAYIEAGGKADRFEQTAGLSLGEYTALHVAGAVSFADALRLVNRRGQLMQQAAEAAQSGMVSLIGADAAAAKSVCEAAAGDEVLVPANFNCPGQVVISGGKAACERAAELAGEHGCRAVALPVAGAFHSPYMDSAALGLSNVLAETPFNEPAMSVMANVDAAPHEGPAAIRDSLVRQVTHPVLWQRSVEKMMASGVDHFVEMGPGKVLTGLMRKIDRKTSATCVNSWESLQSFLVA